MRKYNKLNISDDISIGVDYEYKPMRISFNPEIPTETAEAEILHIILLDGKLMDLLYLVSQDKHWFDWLEHKLLELND